MITSVILYLIYGTIMVAVSLLSFLGTPTLPEQLNESIPLVGKFMATFLPFFSVGTVILQVSIMIGVEITIMTYKGIKWAYQKIPGIS